MLRQILRAAGLVERFQLLCRRDSRDQLFDLIPVIDDVLRIELTEDIVRVLLDNAGGETVADLVKGIPERLTESSSRE